MSSSGFDVPLIVEPQRSVGLGLIFVGAHGTAAAALLAAGPPWWLATALAVGAATSLRAGWRRHVSRAHPRAVRRAVWAGEEWWLEEAGGRHLRARLLPGALVVPPLVVLRLRPARGRARSLLLAADAVSPGALRRLRVRLRALPVAGTAGDVHDGVWLSTLGQFIPQRLRPRRRDDAGPGQR